MTRYLALALLGILLFGCKKEPETLPTTDISNCFVKYLVYNGTDTVRYYYNARQMLDSAVTRQKNSYYSTLRKYEYKYANGRLDSVIESRYGMGKIYHYSYIGDMITVESIDQNSGTTIYADYWHKDSSGRITHAEHYYIYNGNVNLDYKENLVYDKWGNVAKSERESNYGGNYTLIYVYDLQLAPQAGLPLDMLYKDYDDQPLTHFGPNNVIKLLRQNGTSKPEAYNEYKYSYNASHLPKTRDDGRYYSYSCE